MNRNNSGRFRAAAHATQLVDDPNFERERRGTPAVGHGYIASPLPDDQKISAPQIDRAPPRMATAAYTMPSIHTSVQLSNSPKLTNNGM